MKKLFVILVLLLGLGIGLWIEKKELLTSYLSYTLKTKVELESLSWEKKRGFILENLTIYNPKDFKTPKALSTKLFSLDLPLNALWRKKITIPLIHLKDTLLEVEYLDKEEEKSNWSYLLESEGKEKKAKRSLFIETLLLENLQLTITSFAGKQKVHPAIKKLELKNISSENFPVGKIETAILKEVIKSTIYTLGLKPLLKTVNPKKWLPKVFPVPFFQPKKKDQPNQ